MTASRGAHIQDPERPQNTKTIAPGEVVSQFALSPECRDNSALPGRGTQGVQLQESPDTLTRSGLKADGRLR
jgi:hypothetical protein